MEEEVTENGAEAPAAGQEEVVVTQSGGWEKLKSWLISSVGCWAIRCIGATLRWQIEGLEHHEAIGASGRNRVFVFWHGRMFTAAYYFRNRDIVVMASRNRDGEYMARVIHRLGYRTVRGSSSRGSRRALVGMIQELRRKKDVAFTIDGPRGPRYIAKPGATYVAWKTGNPVLPFNISARNKWTLSSWDAFQIPKPFSPVVLLFGAPIIIPSAASDQEIDEAQQEVQRSLDALRRRGDSYWRRRIDTDA